MASVWKKGTREPVPTPFNLAACVLARAAEVPDKSALEIVGSAPERWTFAELSRAVGGVTRGFADLGLAPGARVLLRLGNDVDFPLAFLGAIAAGLVPVPTSSHLTVAEVTRMARIVDPALIVAAPGIALPDPRPCTVLMRDILHGFTHLPAADCDMGDPDRPAYVIFSSGTSGEPRAVVHAHRAVWARRMMHDGWYGLRPDDRMLHAGAFNWTYTLGTGLMDPWSVGATAVVPAAGTEPSDLPALIADHQVTLVAAAPGIFRQMLRTPFPPLPCLRHALSAGETLPGTTRAAWTAATGTDLHEAFGMSECSTFLSGSPAHPAPPGTLGRPQNGRHIALLDRHGAPVPVGQPGIIAVAADDPGLMLGYFNAPGATRDRFHGGWFLTGDMATMDENGAVAFLGREDDMMNAGGFRVSPAEVEAAMSTHPGVYEAAAVELRVKADATVIALFYVPEDGPVPEAVLSAHAATRLAVYKCPRLFVPVGTLPRGANNKVLRRALRDDWETANPVL